MLAFSLNGAHRTDEAIKAWQELLELTPEDHDAAATLGNLLISQKRFKEAIPLLEAAAKKSPDSPALQMSLGNAYLLTGDQEKGVSALNSAMKLSPGPGLKNDAGYALAEANVRLPEALQYAKDAVQEEETASRDVHLNKLDVFALEHTRHLSAYWDTLGWVYFRMSKFPEAESYLFAAWQLSQDSTVADHLGQTYEQEHRPDDAVHMYRLALSINSHLPDTQGRLNHLVPAKTKPANSLAGGAELSQMRSTKLARLLPGTASAEFFFLFAPGPKVQDVMFISGSEELRTKSKTLAATTFSVPFPSGSDARIVRRGILGCYPSTGCSLVMLAPRTVQSPN